MMIYLETLGCQMNRLDSELVIGRLVAAGHEMVDNRAAADVVLYNTCSVRVHAEDKIHSRLGRIRAESRTGGTGHVGPIVGVLGCMAQRAGAALRKRHPHVSIVCAPGRLGSLAEMIASAAGGRPTVALDPDRKTHPAAAGAAAIDAMDLSRDPAQTPNGSQAYVRVMRGCDNFCSYCIVPFVRGPEVSRQAGHIVDEVRRLADAGRSEITLLGQTVNRYRWSDGAHAVSFADLLTRVSAVPGVRRLRFVTSHPLDFGDDVLRAMAGAPNICRYIHCPAQSGADAMLRAMNRSYTRGHYDDLVDRARAIMPDVVLASDFIVGFPGETEADHQASADLIRRSGFRNSFIFKYSPRPGTAAAKTLTDDVPQDVKKHRNSELLAVQAEVSQAHHDGYIGRTVEVIVEGPSRRVDKQAVAPTAEALQLSARTRGDHIVVFDGPPGLAGQYVDVEITGATAITLFGKLGETPRTQAAGPVA